MINFRHFWTVSWNFVVRESTHKMFEEFREKNLRERKKYYRIWQFDAFSVVSWQISVFVAAFSEHGRNIRHNVVLNMEWAIHGKFWIELVSPFTFEVYRIREYQCSRWVQIVCNRQQEL
jgi:hypothetical protein